MSKNIKLKKGFNINLAGKSANKVVEYSCELYAVKPTDFIGFEKPKMLVAEGDIVKAGQPLYYDKSLESVKFVSPVSGKVVEVKRGEKRKLLEIKIEADKSNTYLEHTKYNVSEIANLSADQIKTHIAESGVWPQIIQRPFAVVAKPTDTPKAIFISAFDSSPLAPNYDVIFKGQEQYFKTGIELLKKLTSGPVHLTISSDAEISKVFSGVTGVQLNKISGPHPAGNVGVQIHHISPINKGDIYWTLNPYGVIQIGKLFTEGKYDASKIIALAGSEVKEPQYYKTISGASVKGLLSNNLNSEHVRVISGNILTGEKIGKDGFLGFYDHSVSVIPEGDDYVFFGSFVPTKDRLSIQRAFGLFSFLNGKNKEYVIDTNISGEHRAFVQTGVMEKVLPMDIYPQYLLKSIITEDYDEMEALGIYEVAEEDVALCEFVDVSKHEVQSIIRRGIEMIRNS